ncbi:MAG: iron-sulfur cluster assembly scaffold protein [Alphaproteobacteria bacterium]
MIAEVYRQAIIDAARAALGAGRLEAPDAAATLDSPLCGDRARVEVRLSEGRIAALAHQVRGCLLCQAAASVMAEIAIGKSAPEVAGALAALAAMLGEPHTAPGGGWKALEIFAAVAPHPIRHGCVLLPFQALGAALSAPRG